ncbi:MAG: hypothetical protein EOM18_11520 [Clostridia bacterium]|nr:hypothetical protein [Clostridia bacterium]
MNHTKTPAVQPASKSIMRSFVTSNKKHLLITGSRGIGKSTLVKELLKLLSCPTVLPGITTHAFPQSHVEIMDNLTGQKAVIGQYSQDAQKPLSGAGSGNHMLPIYDGFRTLGIPALKNAIHSDCPWVFLDELGYLESSCEEFQNLVHDLFDTKNVIAVLRKQSTLFLDRLRSRKDVYLYDLDAPILPLGCVIMASGLGKRFGGNKLMAHFSGEPLISHILGITGGNLFKRRIVVTRHPDIDALCRQRHIDVILHDLPGRNDTVRLGLSSLIEDSQLSGCLFTSADQPLLSRESLETMALSFSVKNSAEKKSNSQFQDICRLSYSKNGKQISGNPVLFANRYYEELLHLPSGKGGSVIIGRYPNQVMNIPVSNPLELEDVDTPADLDSLERESLSGKI